MRLRIKVINPMIEDKLPQYATAGAAGLDLNACIAQALTIKPDETVLVATGFAIYMEDRNMAALILPRSGLGHKYGIVLGNLVGLIDSDYQGEIMVSLWNRSKVEFVLNPFDRIAQLVFISALKVDFDIVKEFTPSTRGNNGFGSTGIHDK